MQSPFLVSPESYDFTPENYFAPMKIEDLFPERPLAPLEVELGAGDGSFFAEMVRRTPERNFLAVERLYNRMQKIGRKMARFGARNGRLMQIESHYLVRYLLPPESVTTFHIMFPDPWPKRRHHANRLIQTDFLDAVARALIPCGELRLTTDNLPYFEHMRAVFEPHPGFKEEPWEPGADYPQTDFERGFRAQGLPIYRALLRKK